MYTIIDKIKNSYIWTKHFFFGNYYEWHIEEVVTPNFSWIVELLNEIESKYIADNLDAFKANTINENQATLNKTFKDNTNKNLDVPEGYHDVPVYSFDYDYTSKESDNYSEFDLNINKKPMFWKEPTFVGKKTNKKESTCCMFSGILQENECNYSEMPLNNSDYSQSLTISAPLCQEEDKTIIF